MKFHWIAAISFIAVPAMCIAPQRPITAGTYKQLTIVMRAADRCGFTEYRIGVGYKGAKALYLSSDGSYPCIEAWVMRSARKLRLAPTFEGDIYDH